MPVVFSESSNISDQIRYRKSRTQNQQQDLDPIPILSSSTRSKPTISSLLLAPFSPTSPTHENPTTTSTTSTVISTKKKNFTTFRGLGCTASSQVSVPAVIRTSADWDSKRVKKKKQNSNKNKSVNSAVNVNGGGIGCNNINVILNNTSSSSSCVGVPDVWCGPGIGLTTDAASVDCVVSRRPVSGRGRIENDKVTPRERTTYPVRRMVSPEDNPFLDMESSLGVPRSQVELFASRHHRHSRHGYPEGLAEIVMLQNSLMGGRTVGLDRYRDLRLDVDNMSYEELLELGDKIGYVNTGLREDEIARCVRRTRPFFLNNFSLIRTELERKCSICQEEYEAEDEMGKLDCGHFYHIRCIKQWLMQKNSCPVCKSAAMSND
ncbi:uncharacterized protein LOC107793076 [Nicotiana tabacum]|uniref:RING-type E3 ubiquitin transferase n=1 Tax=Nicotiana tabacum TaxID=4097 RepID=A0A1S4A2P9_TOBAC|nr:PREDICTED: uncharacterized protein LOC107793076 [Nicotiana tabacum]